MHALSLHLLALSYSPLPSRPHAANCGIEMREWRCAKEWAAGCVNPAYGFLLAARDQFTQLRVHFFTHLCTFLERVLMCVFKQEWKNLANANSCEFQVSQGDTYHHVKSCKAMLYFLQKNVRSLLHAPQYRPI